MKRDAYEGVLVKLPKSVTTSQAPLLPPAAAALRLPLKTQRPSSLAPHNFKLLPLAGPPPLPRLSAHAKALYKSACRMYLPVFHHGECPRQYYKIHASHWGRGTSIIKCPLPKVWSFAYEQDPRQRRYTSRGTKLLGRTSAFTSTRSHCLLTTNFNGILDGIWLLSSCEQASACHEYRSPRGRCFSARIITAYRWQDSKSRGSSRLDERL